MDSTIRPDTVESPGSPYPLPRILRRKNQTALRLLHGVYNDRVFLRTLLTNVEDGSRIHDSALDRIQALARRLIESGRRAKRLNSALFLASLIVLSGATAWPLISQHALLGTDMGDLVQNLFQSLLFLFAGSLIACYSRSKRKQCSLESTLRRALGSSTQALQILESYLRNPTNTAATRAGKAPTIDPARFAHQPLVSTSIAQARIKLHSYTALANIFGCLAALSFIVGLMIPLLPTKITSAIPESTVGMLQSVLILGLAALFYQLRRQYLQRRNSLVSALRAVSPESPQSLTYSHIASTIDAVDTGMQHP